MGDGTDFEIAIPLLPVGSAVLDNVSPRIKPLKNDNTASDLIWGPTTNIVSLDGVGENGDPHILGEPTAIKLIYGGEACVFLN